MSSVNKHTIIGRLGADPKEIANGSIVRFSVATEDRWKDKNTGEKKVETDWHQVVCFGQTAGFVLKFLKKGDLVYVCGKSKTRKYEKDDVTQYATEIKAEEVTSLARIDGNQNEFDR